ncbi:hypothetical protein HNY73_023011 [Argiope bruennichi]|uniref:ISXO2-like transposase domain-containing protein n=1 Tax=Argiope bruennichi TaxID=94029 RepID=A0A8T0E413_ARGBR|nr:hypothetical protein HNY73_023011 [Argiope bruennichi]
MPAAHTRLCFNSVSLLDAAAILHDSNEQPHDMPAALIVFKWNMVYVNVDIKDVVEKFQNKGHVFKVSKLSDNNVRPIFGDPGFATRYFVTQLINTSKVQSLKSDRKYAEENSEKIGRMGKIVEVDESKFGKRNYNRGHRVKGQWIFGGVERGSGRTFLVVFQDRTTETLVACRKQWVEPGTVIYSDYWKAYDSLGKEGNEHLLVNQSLPFVQPEVSVN